jgi:DNA/RNA-binding domain of Phe-tRNA-synthetase-like protein
MYFQHSPTLWNDFPQLTAAALCLDNVHPAAEVGPDVEHFFSLARARQQRSGEGEMPEIAAWRRTFSQMNLKPTQYRCAAESLLRRFRQDGDLPRFHPLVDLCNAVSLAYATPIAVFDVACVAGGLEVRYSTGEEEYLAFSDEVERPHAGEVVFADELGKAHARRWTYRQSKRSVVSNGTARVLIVIEAFHAEAPRDVQALVDNLGRALTRAWAAPEKSARLTASQPRLDF